MDLPKILFVDDEPGIRLTMPKILELHGFEVTVAATVAQALDCITKQPFQVLLADLNIGEPGDGFTVVSAMRRTQPNAVTIILTGYPAFETALEAIRKQVDHYVVKPADVDSLVSDIREKLNGKKPHLPLELKRVARIIEQNREQIVSAWLMAVNADPELAAISLSAAERADHVPGVLAKLVRMLEEHPGVVSEETLDAAAAHGRIRRIQGYTVPMIVSESRLLRRTIYGVVQQNLLSVEISYLVPDMVLISDSLDAQIKRSVEAYLAAEVERVA
jgi:ActR/RegA family two-component response regulator